MIQFYAIDRKQTLISAPLATKKCDYFCPECRGPVRLRGGPWRQAHFYHLIKSRTCRQHKKTAQHLQTQLAIADLLPPGSVMIERRFPEIGRIADVAWLTKRLIFEVQCSFISPEEVAERTCDYQKIGYQVIWILHDRRFNKQRLNAAERALAPTPHYFTNINERGKGHIYDQFSLIRGGHRVLRLPPLSIDLTSPIAPPPPPPCPSLNMRRNWTVHFRGDLLGCSKEMAIRMHLLEKRWNRKFLFRLLISGYRGLVHFLLKSTGRERR